MRLSVLDQSPVRSGADAAATLNETVRLAQAAERFGYHRYWLAEHHGVEGFAGPAPEIMVTRVAAATSAIRVGAGGILLSHYSPLKVAEIFRVLETLYPGRIDLGIGRAPGADPLTARALAYGSQVGIEYFPTRVADLMAFLTDAPPATGDLAGVRAMPAASSVPEVWLLGSSDQSASLAARLGLAFSFAHFITPEGGDRVIEAYRKLFRKSPFCDTPRASLGVFVLCAESEAEAEALATCRDLWRLGLERGRLDPFPSVAEAASYRFSRAERAVVARSRERSIVGTPDRVAAGLGALAEQYKIDELVILTIAHDPAARQLSYELTARAMGVTPREK